jgi:CDP-paratose 2-epimerase
MKIALVTGSAGLIGSQACDFFHKKGYTIIGIDNNMRSYFFGKEASTKKSRESLEKNLESGYIHYSYDIRKIHKIESLFKSYGSDIEIVIHTAAQPSHDWAVKEPLTDFGVNALGTMNLLECTRLYCPNATFIFTSTNKVYGDRPNFSYYLYPDGYNGSFKEKYTLSQRTHNDLYRNQLIIKELPKRYEGVSLVDDTLMSISEDMSIDSTKHSIFGSSKVAADIMVQEYGKYFGMKTGVFRGGCLTGPNHAGTELHGFLSYLVKCMLNNKHYTIFGYKGKQVRDNIHSYDLINMLWEYHQNPKNGEVYNVGGGRDNSTSILEAIDTINKITGLNWENYDISNTPRVGDHIWYITDLSKFRKDYPNWDISISLEETLKQMINFEKNK